MSTASKANPWTMTAGGGGGGGGDYHCCPPGNYPGTIVGLFDVGRQQVKEMNSTATVERHQVILVFELLELQPDGKPYLLAKRYTRSLHEKANLYKDVVSIIGKALRDGEPFNILDLAGKPVMIDVANTSNGEKSYHHVAAVKQYARGLPKCPPPTHEPIAWSVLFEDVFPGDTDWLPFVYGKTIKAIAEESTEAKQRGRAAATADAFAADAPF